MALSAQHLYILLGSLILMQLALALPLERSDRALSDGASAAEKGTIQQQRLALYNLLESPGYNPDFERQHLSRYIPLGLRTRQQVVAQQYKEIPVPHVYSLSNGLLLPTGSIRAPYASPQFIQPLDYQETYPYIPPAMYAPAYPYVYKAVIPEEVH